MMNKKEKIEQIMETVHADFNFAENNFDYNALACIGIRKKLDKMKKNELIILLEKAKEAKHQPEEGE